jgi:hypothetical protein
MGEGLTGTQADCIRQASEVLLEAMRAHGENPEIDEAVKLVIKKGRVVGFKARCRVDPPEGTDSVEWLSSLSSAISQLSGYGEVKIISSEDGEVVGARVDVSYDLNHF